MNPKMKKKLIVCFAGIQRSVTPEHALLSLINPTLYYHISGSGETAFT